MRQLRFPRAFPRRTAARTRNARPYDNTGGVGVGADAHIRPAALGRFAARVDGDIDPYGMHP